MHYSVIPKGTVCPLSRAAESFNVFQSSLEFIPDEISIRILGNLCKRDILTCRIISSVMREKIDRLFHNQFCVALTQKQVNELYQKPKLSPSFGKMRLVDTRFLSLTKKFKLRKEYFDYITDLEFSGTISPGYFHQILKMIPYLQILRLNSATLGGTNNLFNGDKSSDGQQKQQGCISSLSTFLRKTFFRDEFITSWENLNELHIKIDYIMPSTTFSPLYLVENLQALYELPMQNLSTFTYTSEESEQKEMFYFTLSSILNFIPCKAYDTLKIVSIVAQKCRPEDNYKSLYLSSVHENKMKCMLASLTQLSQFFIKISSGYHHPVPIVLENMLRAQKNMEKLTIRGIKNVTLSNIIDEIINQNKASLKKPILI